MPAATAVNGLGTPPADTVAVTTDWDCSTFMNTVITIGYLVPHILLTAVLYIPNPGISLGFFVIGIALSDQVQTLCNNIKKIWSTHPKPILVAGTLFVLKFTPLTHLVLVGSMLWHSYLGARAYAHTKQMLGNSGGNPNVNPNTLVSVGSSSDLYTIGKSMESQAGHTPGTTPLSAPPVTSRIM